MSTSSDYITSLRQKRSVGFVEGNRPDDAPKVLDVKLAVGIGGRARKSEPKTPKEKKDPPQVVFVLFSEIKGRILHTTILPGISIFIVCSSLF